MTIPLVTAPVGVREADLANVAETARIDAFVRQHAAGTPFHLTGWSRAIASGCGQRAHYLLAEQADGELVGILPLTEMRSRLFGKAMVSAGFAVDGGILGGARESLASGAWSLAQACGCPGVELRGGDAPEGWETDETSYLGFVRALAADDDAELLAIPRKQRAEVRRSLGFDLEVATGTGATMLAEHYRVYAESVRNLGTPVFPAALFRAVVHEIDADILTVRHGGRAVASVLSLYHGGTVYPYWGGGTAEARALRANDRLYYALMSHARARGCTRFDFGRSKTGTGAAAFKKNWGFVPEARRYAKRSDGPAREVNPLNPKYALMVRTWQKLPLPIANLVGPWIARGLG
jgi:FemAB-related protein (PEP-CTERM system-associated)